MLNANANNANQTHAALLTAEATGAIATIELTGPCADQILQDIFKPEGSSDDLPAMHSVNVGHIISDFSSIDQVTTACIDINHYAIHCHGNPIITEKIMHLLKDRGAALCGEKKFHEIVLRDHDHNTIQIEAKLALMYAKTLYGAKAIHYQIHHGLSVLAKKWLSASKLETIQDQCHEILDDRKAIQPLIDGYRIVLSGPANSGKSTLFNCLLGKSRSIVTDISGTTRDFVSSPCQFGEFYAELIDTAGIDKGLTEAIDRIAQEKNRELIDRADLVLLVLDNSHADVHKQMFTYGNLSMPKIIRVINKSDLRNPSNTPANGTIGKDTLFCSAKTGAGIDILVRTILDRLCVPVELCRKPLALTPRQVSLIEAILDTHSLQAARQSITELLNGPFNV